MLAADIGVGKFCLCTLLAPDLNIKVKYVKNGY